MGIVSVIGAVFHLFSADCIVFNLFAGLPMRDLAKITLRYMKALMLSLMTTSVCNTWSYFLSF